VPLNGWTQRQRAVWVQPLIFLGIALALMAPELVAGTTYNFSFRYNIVWGEQFVALMREGTLYPRWLPQSWDGLGSPTFYFYPPLFFWAAGLIGIFGSGLFDASTAMSLASAAFIALSAYAMRAWLRTQVSERAAFFGAIGFLFVPYRLHDIYTRGALAEATAYLALPLVLLGIHRVRTGGPSAVAMLAASYALLIFGHLPVALLASVTIIPAFALYTGFAGGRPDWHVLIRTLGGGLLGLGLTAIFLWPAIGLLPFVSSDQLFGSYFQPQNSFFFSGSGSVISAMPKDVQVFVVLLALSYLGIAIAALALNRDVVGVRFWAGLGVACFFIVSGLIPQIWQIDLLRQVQFPARLMPIIEVIGVTTMALSANAVLRPLFMVPFALMMFAAVLGTSLAAFRVEKAVTEGIEARSTVLSEYRDAVEYLPRGYPIAFDSEGRPDPGGIVLPTGRGVTARHPAAQIKITYNNKNTGVIGFWIDTPAATEVSIPRFFFPHWTVIVAGARTPTYAGPSSLLTLRVRPGRQFVLAEPRRAPFQKRGRLITFLSALAIILMAALGLWRQRDAPLGKAR
jgi:hypothetical protein